MSELVTYWREPILPWADTLHDRRFKKILIGSFVAFLIFGIIVPLISTPEIKQQSIEQVAPRLAKLILEKKQQPQPKPKAAKKKAKKKKAAKKDKPKQKKKKKKKQESARKKAERSGLMTMRDELADLRESFDIAQLSTKKPVVKGKTRAVIRNSNVLTVKGGQGSGGISTRSLSRQTGGGSLQGRASTQVSSNLVGGVTRTSRGKKAGRSNEEVQLVFQKNKGAIESIYMRALRKDPTLQGKIVLEITISPSGKVLKCKVVASELANKKLEKRIAARVKLFKFKSKNVDTVIITYPLDLLPS